MKVLFLCRRNKFRSPIAESIFNNMCREHTAISAGSEETADRQLLPEQTIVTLMEDGIDVSAQRRKIVTRGMVKSSDKVIVLCEKKYMPDFVLQSDKTEFWNVQDPESKGVPPLDKTKKIIRNMICEMSL